MEAKSQHEFIAYRKEDTKGYSRGISKLLDLAENYVGDAEKAAEAGKRVAWVTDLAAISYAADTIPVSHTELGRLASPDSVKISENHFQTPKDICTMVNVCLGEWYLRKDKINRLVGDNNTCEAFNMAWEFLKKEGFQVHRYEATSPTRHLSPEETQKRLELMEDEMVSLGKFLNEGEPVSDEKLLYWLEFENDIHRKVERIMELRAKNPFFMKSLETLYMLIGSTHYFGKPEEYKEAIEIILEELERDEYHPDSSHMIPLVWTGGRGQEFSIYQTVDDFGGAILGWEIPTAYHIQYDTSLPPIKALAKAYFDEHHGKPIMDTVQFTKREVDKYNAKGVLIYHYVGCSLGGVNKELTRKYFHEIGVPSLAFDGNFDVGAPSGQLITRVKAFMEMLS